MLTPVLLTLAAGVAAVVYIMIYRTRDDPNSYPKEHIFHDLCNESLDFTMKEKLMICAHSGREGVLDDALKMMEECKGEDGYDDAMEMVEMWKREWRGM